MRRSVRRYCGLVILVIVAGSQFGCKVEELLRLAADGSGSYRARISIDAQFAQVLPELKAKSQKEGYRIVDEGERDGEHYLELAREFTSVDQLSDEDDSYKLTVDRQSWFRSNYRLEATFHSDFAASGFERTLKLEMPVGITRSSAGTVSGNTVVWDASNGGTLTVEAAGMALPFGSRFLGLIAVFLVVLGVGVGVVLVYRSRRAARCGACGAPLKPQAKFCPKCGRGALTGAA
jgi:LppM domain